MEEVKFPFEPNEKVKAAFRQESSLASVVRCVMDALIVSASKSALNPWQTLYREHPELRDAPKNLTYNHFLETIDISRKTL